MGLRTLGIIPARGGSKRLPRKNLRLLGGKTLVARAIEAAQAATRITRLVVSSDDEEILDIARQYAPGLALPRPAALATDTSLAIEFVRHALAQLETSQTERYEAVAIIQPSSPLTLPADIDATLRLLETSQADTAVSVVEVEHAAHPVKLKTMQGDRLLPFLQEERGRMAAHKLPAVFVRNCSVYATRRHVIEQGQIIGEDCRGYVMPRQRSIDINDEVDLAFAEFLLTR